MDTLLTFKEMNMIKYNAGFIQFADLSAEVNEYWTVQNSYCSWSQGFVASKLS